MNENIDLSKTGVYCITNTVNGKRYVGSASLSFRQRWARHRSLLYRGKHHNRHLQGAWKHYGESAFEFAILLLCAPEDCIKSEQQFIDEFQSANAEHGYNISPTAGSALGVKRTEETRRRLSAAGIGKKYDAGRVERSAAPKRGRKHSDEHRQKIRYALLGRERSDTTRAKIGDANRGKSPSVEARLKMSESAKRRGGHPQSQETRDKISATRRRLFREKKAGAA